MSWYLCTRVLVPLAFVFVVSHDLGAEYGQKTYHRRDDIHKQSISDLNAPYPSLMETPYFKNNENLEKYTTKNNGLNFMELREPKKMQELKIIATNTIREAQIEIKKLEVDYLIHEREIKVSKSTYPEDCIPISADVKTFDFNVRVV